MASELKKSFLKGSPYLGISPSEWCGVVPRIYAEDYFNRFLT